MDIKEVLKDDSARGEFLSASRKEMYDALSLFYTHVKHTISLMLSIMTAVFVIFGVALKDTASRAEIEPLFKLLGGVILSALFPLGIVSILIIGRYYKLYVAALMFAGELHTSVGLSSHAWFEHIREDAESLGQTAGKKEVLHKRTYGWPHSWILYSMLIAVLSLLNLIVGISIIVKI